MPRSPWSASSALSSGEVSKEENISLSSRGARTEKGTRESEQVVGISMPWLGKRSKVKLNLLVTYGVEGRPFESGRIGLWSQFLKLVAEDEIVETMKAFEAGINKEQTLKEQFGGKRVSVFTLKVPIQF